MQSTLRSQWTLIWTGLVLGMLFSWAANADLGERFQRERTRPQIREWSRIAEALNRYQVVFVRSNDVIFAAHRAYHDNAASLFLELGARAKFVGTDFFESYETNATRLSAELRRIQSEAGKPLIVVGNPQTSLDVLYTLMKDPGLLPVVEKLVMIAPAFGSPLVDGADRLAPEALDFVQAYFGENYRKFKTGETRAIFNAAVGMLSEEQRSAIARQVYVVRAAAESLQSVTPVLRSGYALLRVLGENDGVTFTIDQKLAALGGVDLGILPADHWDLWVSFPIANTSAWTRHAFTRALFGELLLR